MFDFNHKAPSAAINHLIDTALEREREKEPPRNYLGGSRLGVECERALQFEYTHTPRDREFTGDKLRIFELGHRIEDLIVKWLRGAGFNLVTETPDGKQYGFKQLGGKISGHRDGAFIDGPPVIKYPCLWECKGLGDKYFKQLIKHGLMKYSPVYYGQVQVYMAYFDLTDNPAIFTAINKNDCQMVHLPVDFAPAIAQGLSDKGFKVIEACEAGDLLPRLSNDQSFYKCKLCAFNNYCHSLNF